jgi:hypothetical protein
MRSRSKDVRGSACAREAGTTTDTRSVSRVVPTQSIRTSVDGYARPPAMPGAIPEAKWSLKWLRVSRGAVAQSKFLVSAGL